MGSGVQERLSELELRHRRERNSQLLVHLRLFGLFLAYCATIVFGLWIGVYPISFAYVLIGVVCVGYWVLDRRNRQDSKKMQNRQLRELMMVLRRILPKREDFPIVGPDKGAVDDPETT